MATAEPNSIVEVSSHEVDAFTQRTTFRIPADLPLFRDHFPTKPVLPAFVIVDVAVAVARRRWADLTMWLGASKLKFLLPLGPNQEFTLELTRSGGRVSFSLTTPTDEGTPLATQGELRFDSLPPGP